MEGKRRTNIGLFSARLPKSGLAALLLVALVFSCGPFLLPLLRQAAVASAAVAMPEGLLELLRQRFPAAQQPDASSQISSPPQTSQSAEDTPQASQSTLPPTRGEQPEIEEQYRGTVLDETMLAGTDPTFIPVGNGWLKNFTSLTPTRIQDELQKPLKLTLPKSEEPTVLIYHTHATESFEEYDSSFYDTRNSWRTTDNTRNMVAIGNVLKEQLEAAGLSVLHLDTQHDYPSYNGAYERSAESVLEALEKYPSIRVAIDVHRDAIERPGNLVVAPTVEIDGRKAAQIMVIACCDNGKLNIPNWPENLRLAAALTDTIEAEHPGLMRPILFDYRKYNYNLSPGLLLIEFGAGGNYFEEVVYSAQLAGSSIGKLLAGMQEE